MSTTTTDFKAIIVGGGLSGLLAALSLRSAGFDFILLEQRDHIVVNEGASIALNAATLRILYQLGLLEACREAGHPLSRKCTFFLDGHVWNSSLFDIMQKCHGFTMMLHDRVDLVRVLYNALHKDHHKLLASKKLDTITTDDTGVTVTCTDGSKYSGSIVIGADGVHSKTRQAMRKLALAANVDKEIWEAEKPFPALYRSIYFSFPRTTPRGIMAETHSKGKSIFYVTGTDHASVFLCEDLPEPTTERPNYTEDDKKAIIQRFWDFPIIESLTVGDVAKQEHIASGMIDLEHGVAKKASYERIVIIGDAYHKVTPHCGLGFNMGAQDIAVLVNLLKDTVETSKTGEPTTEALDATFQAYQSSRDKHVSKDMVVGDLLVRTSMWTNWGLWLLGRYLITSRLWEWLFLRKLLSDGIKCGYVLNHIPGEEPFVGKMPWDNGIPARQ